MIVLPNIDGKIWNIDAKTAEIAQHMVTNNGVVISLNSEGPCAQDLGLYDLLDRLCSGFAIAKKSVIIHTCNQLETHPDYEIRRRPPLYVPETQEFATHSKLDSNKNFQPDFRYFGIFIGRSNWIRLWLAGAIWKDYHDHSLMTYHWRPNDEFHRAHLGLDDMLSWNASVDDVSTCCDFLHHCPLELMEVNKYPILSPQHLSICREYTRFFLEVVCETYYSGRSFYPTEKIWRPLLMKTPFIVHGPVDYLRNLRRLGFKTFEPWWDEQYDDYGHDNRVRRIISLLADIQRLSLQDLAVMHAEMAPILQHNHDVFMNLRPSDFPKVFNYD